MPLLVLSIYKHADVKKAIASAVYLIQIVNTSSKKQLFNPRCIATLMVLLCSVNSKAQYTFKTYNLVPNPSFENYINCPSSQYPFNLVNWYNASVDFSLTPVALNFCSTDLLNQLPSFNFGLCFQFPRSRNGFITFFFYNHGLQNNRNYAGVELKDSLKYGKKYYLEFFVNYNNNQKYSCNNIGAILTKNKILSNLVSNQYGLIINQNQISSYGNPVYDDTLKWEKISCIYHSVNSEKFLTIGNFSTDMNTNLKLENLNSNANEIAYNIDDVSVIPLDSIQLQADAGRDTTITKGDSAFIGTLINGLDTLKWQVLVNGQVIDTIRPGFWVKPTTNTCYVLTQTVNGYTSSDTVCVYVNALPVKFLGLVLLPSPVGEGLGVRFSTANEINVSHYNIQYSLNGKDFKTTGNLIPSKGGSLNEYSVQLAPSPTGEGWGEAGLGVVYYRIQATDHDGQQTFSEIKSIKLNTDGVVSIYPNPANNEVTVTGKNIQQISISDVAGKTLIQTNNKKINISSLPNGTYFISIKTNDTYEVQKLVKW